ncbi:MAG: hypothetical protein ABEI74_00490 [Candidatus Pacearchaeota archaeon]
MVKKSSETGSGLIKEIYNFDPSILQSVRGKNTLEINIDLMSMNVNRERIKKNQVLKVKNGKIIADEYENLTSIGKPNEKLGSFLKFVSEKGKEINYLDHIARIFSIGEENEIENTRNYNFEHFYRRAKRKIYDVGTLKTDALYETTIKKGREYFCFLEGKDKNDLPEDYERKVNFDLSEIFDEQ